MTKRYPNYVIIFVLLTLTISYGQQPGEFINVFAHESMTNTGFEQNALNGGAMIDPNGNFIHAKSTIISGNRTNVANINGYIYTNILNDNSGNESVCTNALISENNVVVWGAVNVTCCDFDVALQVYAKDIFPNSLLGETGPANEANITSELSLYITSTNGIGRIKNVVRNNQYLYVVTTGFGSGFDYQTTGLFGTQTGFVPVAGDSVLRLDTSTGIIDQSYVSTSNTSFSRGSLTLNESNNTILVLNQITSDTSQVITLDPDLQLIDISEDFYYCPNCFGLDASVNRPILIDYNPADSGGSGTAGTGDEFAIILGNINPNDDKDIIRKLQNGTVVPFNDETTIGEMYFPPHAHEAITTPEHYVFLRYNNNGENWISMVNKETGSFDIHQGFPFTDSAGNFTSGLYVEDMVYDHVNNEIDFIGTYTGFNKSLAGVALPDVPSGHRGITFSYKLGIPSEAEVNVSIVGYPNASIQVEGNHFMVSGIPETQWNNLTLDVSFSNNSNFILAPGLNGSFTKDFSDDDLDLFIVGTNGAANKAEVGFVRIYTVAMTTTMSVTDNTIDTFGVYPNPARDMLYVPNELSNSSVEIFNIQGQLVHSDTKLSSTINVSHLSRGMYIMKFQLNNKQYTQKLILE